MALNKLLCLPNKPSKKLSIKPPQQNLPEHHQATSRSSRDSESNQHSSSLQRQSANARRLSANTSCDDLSHTQKPLHQHRTKQNEATGNSAYRLVRANYDAELADEISVRVGAVVLFLSTDTEPETGREWSYVQLEDTGQRGFVPSDILTTESVQISKAFKITRASLRDHAVQRFNGSSHHHPSMNFHNAPNLHHRDSPNQFHSTQHGLHHLSTGHHSHHNGNHHSHPSHHDNHHHPLHHRHLPTHTNCPSACSHSVSHGSFLTSMQQPCHVYDNQLQTISNRLHQPLPPHSLQGSSSACATLPKFAPLTGPPSYSNLPEANNHVSNHLVHRQSRYGAPQDDVLIDRNDENHHHNSDNNHHHHHRHHNHQHLMHAIPPNLIDTCDISDEIWKDTEKKFRPFSCEDFGPYVMLNDFNAQEENDLSVKFSETVNVLNKDDEDWFWVRNKRGHEGFVPAKFTYSHEKAIDALNQANSTATVNMSNHFAANQINCHTYMNQKTESR